MSLRSKLLFAQAPLLVALAVAGWVASSLMSAMGRSSDRILRENYRSVLAAERMKTALVDLDHGVVTWLAGDRAAGATAMVEARKPFEVELQAELDNITEAGEQEAADRLAARWREYVGTVDGLSSHAADATSYYFREVVPALHRVRDAADTVLDINQDAMLRKSAEAQRLASRANLFILVSALGGALLGILASGVLTSRLLRPLSVLSQAARRLGEGDLAVRARVSGSDEVAKVAAEFNVMAERLVEYRDSSLGELLQAQQAVQAAIDSMPDPVAVISSDGRITNINEAAASLLGVGAGDEVSLVASPLRDVIERVRQPILAGHGPLSPRSFDESVRVGAGAAERALLPRGTPMYDDDGHVIGSTVVLQDVTRLLRLDELRRNVVATVAHEFRTPLTSLHMSIHLCLEEAVGPLTDKQAELLTAAREDCERLQRIVDDVLELSRAQSAGKGLELQPVAAEALVTSALSAQRSAVQVHPVELRSDVGPEAGLVQADPDRLATVFANLLANAIRHSPPGGTVTVAARAAEDGVRFEVADEGEGIPAEFHARVFEKAFQVPGADHGAAGLGLSIARDIVLAHGGDIGVESEPGRGSRFWFTIPDAPAQRAPV